MKCFYHNDLDGRCAAWAVHSWVGIKPENGIHRDAEFIEINYNKPFPFDAIRPDEQIWIVDFSIKPEEMERLLSITGDVTWIDHHKTAIEKYADFPHDIRGVRKDGEAGCMLTFKYIHWWTERGDGPIILSAENKNIPIPECVKLVEDWDIWKFEYGDRTREFHAGMGMENTSPDSNLWWDLYVDEHCGNVIDGEMSRIIANGKVALKYRFQWAKGFMKAWSFPVNFEGYKCIAANLGYCNSEYFKSVEQGYDIMMPFIFDGKQWTVSLYSRTVDVGAIAKKYGGGGHKGAAGFQCVSLPFMCMDGQRG